MSKQLKRISKSKKDIVSDLQLVQDAERRRALVKDILFPHLVEINESVGYSKVYLQALSGIINGVYEDMRKTTTVGQLEKKIIEKLDGIFDKKDKQQKQEYERYVSIISKMNDISVQDFSYAAELPRFIDGFLMKNEDKKPITVVDINAILG